VLLLTYLLGVRIENTSGLRGFFDDESL